MATEVWVNAAAFIMIPSNFFLASWIILTSSPSTFDWANSRSRPISCAFLEQFSLSWSNVVDPYCDCSLSPNRLRFGPLIIIILLLIQHLYTMKKIKKIKIKINGKIKSINQDSNLSIVLKNLKISLNKVAIELNEEIIDKKKINKIKLNKNDKIEIVHFIGGG